MNQILVTEKLYVTPELRKKKKIYKIEFFLSVFFICLLFSYYIYAEYDRTKTEQVSQEILAGIQGELRENEDKTVRPNSDEVLIVALDVEEANAAEEELSQEEENDNQNMVTYTAANGNTYNVESTLTIPKLDLNYVVLAETSEELLKVSLNKYWGPKPNEVGNYCIVGHNYKNKKLFGGLSELDTGDIAELTDVNGKKVKYQVYNKFVVDPNDTSCTSQLTNGKRELTLITCTNYGTQRLIVKCREIK